MAPHDGPDRRERLSELTRDVAPAENRTWARRMLDRETR